jgi:protein TonB
MLKQTLLTLAALACALAPSAAEGRGTGPVVVKIWVNEQGRVTRVNVICGHAFLAGVSETAARQARFTPTLLDGRPVKVSGVITYNFIY